MSFPKLSFPTSLVIWNSAAKETKLGRWLEEDLDQVERLAVSDANALLAGGVDAIKDVFCCPVSGDVFEVIVPGSSSCAHTESLASVHGPAYGGHL